MSESENCIKSLTAYEAIRELILSGKALAGSRLVIADLEEKLGIGRGPIREALLRLDRSGLVQNVPRKGAIVMPPPSFSEIQHIYNLRVDLECVLAIEAMRIANFDDIKEVERKLHNISDDNDGAHFFIKDRAFHRSIYVIACMPHLLTLLDSLLDHVEVFLTARHYHGHDRENLEAQHQAIVDALRYKDAAALTKAVKANVLIGLELIKYPH